MFRSVASISDLSFAVNCVLSVAIAGRTFFSRVTLSALPPGMAAPDHASLSVVGPTLTLFFIPNKSLGTEARMGVALFDENALAAPSGRAFRPPVAAGEISRTTSGRIVFTTSFGLEDQALTHAIFSARTRHRGGDARYRAAVSRDLRRVGRDGRALRAAASSPTRRRRTTLANLVAAQGINGFRSSVAARQACCGVRKVEPLRRALAGAAAWITGLRAEQSRHRADVALAAFDEAQGLIKIQSARRLDARRRRALRGRPSHSLQRRCTTAASPRSAARRARAPCASASPSGPGAGGGRRTARRNAVCIFGRRSRRRRPRAWRQPDDARGSRVAESRIAKPSSAGPARLTHLQRLEAESIHILREVVAESENPVLLYSIGKDSSVLLHLAQKAFYPARLPFPLLHVDTTWKFRDMIAFRDAARAGTRARPDRARQRGRSQARHRPDDARLRDPHRRDEDAGAPPGARPPSLRCRHRRSSPRRGDIAGQGAGRSRSATPIIAGTRSASAPEPWRLYNTRKRRGESFRVFPLSNWTELDIWLYIEQEQIPIVPLYFAAERPVVERDGMLIMRRRRVACRCEPGEQPELRSVRFRTLGCYPLTGAVESTAATLPEIIRETLGATHIRAARPRHRPGRRRRPWNARSRKVISDDRSCLARCGRPRRAS